MEVQFRSRRLQRCHESGTEAIREWGPIVGRQYVRRVNAMIAARDLTDLYGTRSLGVHPLTGERRGQLAMRLTGQMRLIFTVDDKTLIVEEVVDYHE